MYFVSGSTPPVPSLPNTPPRLMLSSALHEPSEPASCKTLDDRDGHVCILCGSDQVQNCHIVDKSRGELLFGLDNIDDVRNMVQLCPTHHGLFDSFQFVFVPCNEQTTCVEYFVALTPLSCDRPSNSLAQYLGTTISFASNAFNNPLPHLFLLKQLGRFDLRCTVPGCSQSCRPNGWQAHIKSHKAEYHELAQCRPLPRVCSCSLAVTESGVAALYDHVAQAHPDLLYFCSHFNH